MSFDNSSPFAQWQSSVSSSADKLSQPRQRGQPPSAWGQPSGSKRGLTPLATSNLSAASSSTSRRQLPQTESDSTTSPLNSNFPPLSSITNRFGQPRATPPASSHTNSPITILQAGAHQSQSHQSNRLVTSPRSRTNTPSQTANTAVGSTLSHTSLGAAGGGGHGAITPSGTQSPPLIAQTVGSPTHLAFERSSSISSNPTATTGQSSLSKISATQVLLLLDTITEKEGQAKWEAKAEKIRKLLDSNGMEVFAQFFRRVVTQNATVIFSGAKGHDEGSYKLLQQELQKVPQSPEQANKIAEVVDNTKEDIFRDFDLPTFVQHFYSDPLQQTLLTIAFTKCAKSDLRTKAEKILSTIAFSFLRPLSNGQESSTNISTKSIVALIEYYAMSGKLGTPEQKYEFYWAIGQRYESSSTQAPAEVMAALQLLRLPDQRLDLARLMLKTGIKSTHSKQAAEDLVVQVGIDQIDEMQVANALLFGTFSMHSYNLKILVVAINTKVPARRLNWDAVVQNFDIQGMRVRAEDFLSIFNALLVITTENTQFDIQKLWGGRWQQPQTQISFLKAYFASNPEDIMVSKIPKFRHAYGISDFRGLSDDLKRHVETSLKGHYASEDAMRAVFEVALGPDTSAEDAERMELLAEIYQQHSITFLLSLPKVASKPWVADQEKFVAECFSIILDKQKPESTAVLRALSLQDTQFVFDLCTSVFQLDPRQTEVIYDRAQELGWTDDFLKHWSNPLALDIACMHDKLQSDFDLDKHLSEAAESQPNLGVILFKYLRIKADDEFRVQRDQSAPQSVPLGLRTVHTLLEKLEDYLDDRELVKGAQTTCLQTYPRLMNFGAGFDEILEATSESKGNKLPEEIDKQMSSLFGRMYRSEISIRDMINEMRTYKTSNDPMKQDLFCCIVHGLFDEYVCYSEYPEDALEKTALLFGSIVKYKLLPSIPRDFGLALILEAVRDHPSDSLMHRFGVEALLQISDQLEEWPGLCSLLLQVPTLQHPEILQRAQDGLQNRQSSFQGSGALQATDSVAAVNGNVAEILKSESVRGFRSLMAEGPPVDAQFADPDQTVQDKILFVVNNLSQENMTTKITDLKKVLSREHFQWFASYLVDQRARLEPNNQEMYFQSLELLGDKTLMSEVVRETFVSIVRMMNADSTANSATERTHLKNLGAWLGTITLAQDKPIKHKNVYFVDLLIEAYDTQRLIVVIPFTCKVLAQGARSMIFKPPNPWLMEIIHLLKELYNIADLKLNLKFEIEVLYKDLKLDFKKVEPSTAIRDRPQTDEDLTNLSALPDGLESLDEIASLNGAIGRSGRERLTAVEIMATLPNLEDVLKYPPTSGSPVDQALVKSIIYRAVDQAIQEIIAPVVERSITIASISTAQLISKDYAFEPDVEKYRAAARQMVKSLAGSLALVTCKEPLRMSITNYIRRPNDDLPEHLLPEGAILMCVNDNLDAACSFVEQAAELRAIPEIDHVIEPELEERRRFQAEGGTGEFVGGNVNRWSTWIPEPYKQTVGGLKDAQRAVYEEFDRRVHGMEARIQSGSTDASGRQIPDILQDSLAMPNISTPAGQPALPHQSPMGQQESRSLSAMQQPRLNGFPDNIPPHERIFLLIDDIQKAARTSSAVRMKDLEKNSPVFQDSRQILIVLTSSNRPAADLLARQIAERICNIFVSKPPQALLEAELLAFLLSKLCQLSELIVRDVLRWMTVNEELILSSPKVVSSLVSVGLLDLIRVDNAVAAMLHAREIHGLQLLSDFLDHTLFIEEPIALRADFANSLIEMCMWQQEKPDLQPAVEINQRLRAHGMPEFVGVEISDRARAKQDQMRYVFDEWVGIFENVDAHDSTCAAFLKELHQEQLINNSEDLTEFIRLCIDSCCDCFEKEAHSPRGSLFSAFLHADALARLILLLVRFQGESEGAVHVAKAPYLDSLLSTLVLVMNHHQVMRGVHFNQRVFGRLIGNILFEYAAFKLHEVPEHGAMMLVMAKMLKSLQPAWFPSFVFAWNGLIMHRVFVMGMLNTGAPAATEAFRELIGLSILYPAELQKVLTFESVSADLYKGLFRNILVLYRDYPDFICENYPYFCARIPFYAPQLRNVILTSRPSNSRDLADPSQIQGRLEQLEEMKNETTIASDYAEVLDHGLQGMIDRALEKNGDVDTAVKHIRGLLEDREVESTATRPNSSVELLAALLPYIGQDGVREENGRFDASSPHATFLTRLVDSLSPKCRYSLINVATDQIRYPNNQTDFFLKFVLHLWAQENSESREIIARVAYERLAVTRPHPWAMVILFLELQQNGAHEYWGHIGSEGMTQPRSQPATRSSH